jgi:cell shape-determining protein MreD
MRQTKRKQLSRRSVRRPRLRNTIRWILYVLFIFLAFVTANGGDFIKPLLLIPVALCIASVSGTVVSGGIGILCGLLLDISCGTLPGYHGILLFLICLFTSRSVSAPAFLEHDVSDGGGFLCGDRTGFCVPVCHLGI